MCIRDRASSEDNTANGTFLTLTFNVLEGASFGKTEVTISRVDDGYMKDGVISNRAEESVHYRVDVYKRQILRRQPRA